MDMCAGMRAGMCMDVCVVCTDTRVGMCMDVCMDVCMDMCVYSSVECNHARVRAYAKARPAHWTAINCIGHNYTGHDVIGHDCVGHNYTGHN